MNGLTLTAREQSGVQALIAATERDEPANLGPPRHGPRSRPQAGRHLRRRWLAAYSTAASQGRFDCGTESMALTNEDQVREMARLAGLPLAPAEVPEVTSRLNAILDALDALRQMDLQDVQPFIVAMEEEEPGGGE